MYRWQVLRAIITAVVTPYVFALPQGTETATSPSETSTGVPTITVSTAVPSPTAPLTNTLPSQAPLPPRQEWCPSEIFCAGTVSRPDHHPTFGL